MGQQERDSQPGLGPVTGRAAAVMVSGTELEPVTQSRRLDAVTVLTVYVFLMMAIPAALVVGPLGAVGAPADIFAAILFCWYLVARLHSSFALGRGQRPVRAAAILFACAVIASYVSANRVPVSGLQENGADRGLILLCGWLGVLLLAADGIDRMDRLRTLLRRIVLGVTAMAVLGLVEFCTGVDPAKYIWVPGLTAHAQISSVVTRAGLPRVMATAAQPLEFAAVLAVSLPLAIHQARFASAALRRRRWLQVALVGGAALMTVSRSTILALAVIGLVLLPTWPKLERRRAYLVALVPPFILWLVKPNVLSGLGGLFGQLGTDQSSKSRTGAYSQAAYYIAHHPWLGTGLGTFFPQTYFFTDNQYLISLIETGVIGTAALVGLFAAAWFTARSVRRVTADPQTRDLAQCMAASVAAAAVCFATFDALSFSIASGLCFLSIGCIAALRRLALAQQT